VKVVVEKVYFVVKNSCIRCCVSCSWSYKW